MKYPTVKKTYDLRLSDWGPYSKVLAGISHIENRDAGEMLEFCIFPGFFRGPVQLPSELWQDNRYPWYAKEDLSSYTYRFELEWKDRVYTDISYLMLDENRVLVRAECVNNTEITQNLCLNYLANRRRPKSPIIKGDCGIIDPLAYDEIDLKTENLLEGLAPDATLVGEVVEESCVNGHALGGLFGQSVGDRVKYTVKGGADTLYLRIKGRASLSVNGIPVEVDSTAFDFIPLPLNEGTIEIETVSPSNMLLDAICLCKKGDTPSAIFDPELVIPTLEKGKNQIQISYPEMKNTYGIAWQGEGYQIKEYFSNNINCLIPHMAQDHASSILGKDRDNHYTNIFVRPIPLKAGERKALYGILCCGNENEVKDCCNEFLALEKMPEFPIPDEDKTPYDLGQRLMRATMLTNIVFPIRLQGGYVRHFTPGKWWNTLYTWDNGFLALGFVDFAPELAIQTFEMYLTDVGNPHAAFVHHGSMVPVQAYVYKRLYDKLGDKEFLRRNYASMKQYYDFYVGRDPRSHTRDLKSGLLSTFRYFYNSGGWDDYPAQGFAYFKAEHGRHHAPAVNTSHAINFARIMMHAAAVLGFDDSDFRTDIVFFTDALQRYSYDKECGYFSYVSHDENDNPIEPLRHFGGQNFNMGLDGAYPALVGAATEEQTDELLERIMSPDRMWTDIGISVVDKSADYYKKDGYWNGSVWLPHQWFVFLAMLEHGRDDYAQKIALTGLELWKKETDYSYRCCEHFMVDSERGAGWMCFGGLSSPAIMWHDSLYKAETVTVPVNLRIEGYTPSENSLSFSVLPYTSQDKVSTVLFVPKREVDRILINGSEAAHGKIGNALSLRISTSAPTRVEVVYK